MYIVQDSDNQMMVAVDKTVKSKLLSNGYDGLTVFEKNDLAIMISTESGMILNEITPDYILQYHKNIKKAALSQQCDDIISAGFTASNGHTYRTNRDDQINMIGQKDDLADGSITVVPWKTEDAGYIDHTREEWLGIYGEAFAYKKQQLLHYNTLKKAVTDALTHPDIIAVTWE
jgi:hypothetical protein